MAGWVAAGPLTSILPGAAPVPAELWFGQGFFLLVVSIAVRYRYVRGIANQLYPDYQWLMREIEQFLTHYPRPMDYWEIVNKHLTQMLLKKYPMLASVTSVIEVGPTRSVPHARLCIVTRSRSGSQ